MVKFEKVSRFADIDLPLPTRATANSAGYDFVVAEDIVIPPYDFLRTKIQDDLFEKERHEDFYGFIDPLSLDEMAALTKELKAKIPLVSTGMKCHLEPGQYLELSARSSTPLKQIFFQIINLSPFAIQLKRGDKIGQGIIHTYGVTDDDAATGERVGGFGSTSK